MQENEFQNVVCKMVAILLQAQSVTILRPEQNGHHFPDDMFNCILLIENVFILIYWFDLFDVYS